MSGQQVKLLLGTKVKLYRQARQEPRCIARWTVISGYHSASRTTLSIPYVQMTVKLNGAQEDDGSGAPILLWVNLQRKERNFSRSGH